MNSWLLIRTAVFYLPNYIVTILYFFTFIRYWEFGLLCVVCCSWDMIVPMLRVKTITFTLTEFCQILFISRLWFSLAGLLSAINYHRHNNNIRSDSVIRLLLSYDHWTEWLKAAHLYHFCSKLSSAAIQLVGSPFSFQNNYHSHNLVCTWWKHSFLSLREVGPNNVVVTTKTL